MMKNMTEWGAFQFGMTREDGSLTDYGNALLDLEVRQWVEGYLVQTDQRCGAGTETNVPAYESELSG